MPQNKLTQPGSAKCVTSSVIILLSSVSTEYNPYKIPTYISLCLQGFRTLVHAQNQLVRYLLASPRYHSPFCLAQITKEWLPVLSRTATFAGHRPFCCVPVYTPGTTTAGRIPWHLPLGTSCPPTSSASPPALLHCLSSNRGMQEECLSSFWVFTSRRRTAKLECLCLDGSHFLRNYLFRLFTFSLLCFHNPDKWELGHGWMYLKLLAMQRIALPSGSQGLPLIQPTRYFTV